LTVQPTSTSVATAIAQIAAGAVQVSELKSDRIVAAFERQILSGRLPPGARLPTEDELCESLGVSRTVVRDSVRALVARGLLTVRQGRGTTVAEPSDAAYSNAMLALLTRFEFSMREVFQARATIETSLVALAAKNGTPEDWDALEAAYTSFAEAVSRDDRDAATSSHARFHAHILAAVHQPALTLMLRPMSDLTIVCGAGSVRPGHPEDWEVEAHEPILAALKAGNGEDAIRALTAHYKVSTRPEPYQAVMDHPFADAYFNDAPS
jgi:GntR family transcriptional repressor for pyruvate dehydrogenase complex